MKNSVILKSLLQGVFFGFGTYLLSIVFNVFEGSNIVFDFSVNKIAQHVIGGFLFFLVMIYSNSRGSKK